MKKHQVLLSCIPLFGYIIYVVPVFFRALKEGQLTRFYYAVNAFLLGLLSFTAIQLSFLGLTHVFNVDFVNYLWLILVVFYVSLFMMNLTAYYAYNKFIRKLN